MRDDTVPGRSTLSDWERPPVGALRPLRLAGDRSFTDMDRHRWSDITFTLVDDSGHAYPFFFDGWLGRLCVGRGRDDPDAAFVAPESPLLHAVLDVLTAHERDDERVSAALIRARRYGLRSL